MRVLQRAGTWAVAVAVATAATVVASPAPVAASGPGTGSILASVNASRAAAGRPALSLRADLSAVALRWSQKMAASGTLAHNPNLTRQVSGWRWVGENVGYGPDWHAVQVAFMNSAGHRSNILDRDYTQIGIGVVRSGSRVWITQVFRRPSGATSAKPKPRRSGGERTADATPRRSTRRSQASGAERRASAPRRPAPTPTELLQRRIRTARAALPERPAADPLAAALGFADAMRTVSG